MNPISLLVVGHGTRKTQGAQQLRQLVEAMRGLQPEWQIFESFLELAEPSIERAMEQAATAGTMQLLVVPILLFEAGHAKSDIPDAIAPLAERLGLEIVGQTSPLGTRESILELSDHRYGEVADRAKTLGCPAGHCAMVDCVSDVCRWKGTRVGRVGLAMVGRGTSDTIALEQMRQLTERCSARRELAWSATGFFAGGTPTVDALLAQAASAPCDTVVVQPHLLFEGELMDQLRKKILECRERHPDRHWILARALGAEAGLARVFVEIAKCELGIDGARP